MVWLIDACCLVFFISCGLFSWKFVRICLCLDLFNMFWICLSFCCLGWVYSAPCVTSSRLFCVMFVSWYASVWDIGICFLFDFGFCCLWWLILLVSFDFVFDLMLVYCVCWVEICLFGWRYAGFGFVCWFVGWLSFYCLF